jgi:DHA1 family bicyclomycin/chloramphenicol resistance-like MFS transporter
VTAEPTAPPPHLRKGRLIALLAALTAFGPLSTDLYLPSLPSLALYFSVPASDVQLTLSVFLGAFAVSQLVYGPVSDRFGRRPALLAGAVLFAIGSLACALAPTIETLIAARFVQAVGACSGPVVCRAVVRDLYAPEQAARALAYIGAAMALAPAIGPVIGGVLEHGLGWRANFVLVAALAAASIATIWFALAESNRQRDAGALAPARMLANYRRLLAHRQYRGLLLTATAMYSGLFCFISGSSFVFIGAFELTPSQYGLCFGAVVCGYIAGSIISTRVGRRLGLHRLGVLGLTVLAGAGLLMAVAGIAWPLAATVLVPMILFMLGYGLAMPATVASALGPFPQIAGAASALIGFCQFAVAALIGYALSHAAPGSAAGMSVAIAALGVAALVAYVAIASARGGFRAPS